MEKKIITDFENTYKKPSLNDEVKFRKEFLNKFIEKGFPSKKLESWKFSDLNQIINKNIENLIFYNDTTKSNKIDESLYLKNLEHNKIVFINGKLEEIKFEHENNNKIKISKETKIDDNLFKDNALIDLNNAFAIYNYKIHVEDDYNVKKPIIIYHTTNKELNSTNINIQLNFSLGENSFIKVVDVFNDLSNKNFILPTL